MKFSPEQVEEAKQIAGRGGQVRLTPDRRILHVAPVTADGAAQMLRMGTRDRTVVQTRIFPFGAGEQETSPWRLIQLDMTRVHGIVEHRTGDFVMTARAGTPLRVIQEAASAAGQWLPVDPPADSAMTIGEIIAKNEFGPRRTGYGTIREHLLGATICKMDGTTLRTGGAFVKAATGYDLHKLQIGALESLAVGLEFTFRLRAKPSAAATVVAPCEDRGTAIEKALRIRELPDAPAALFVLGLPGEPVRIVIRYEGSEAAVNVAVERLRPVAGPNRVDPFEGEKILTIGREAGLDPGFRTAGRGPVAIRLGSRPSRMVLTVHTATSILERFHTPVSICVHPGSGLADVWIPRPKDVDPKWILQEIRAALHKAEAGNARLRRPMETFGGALTAELQQPSLAIMAAIKRSFDPYHLLNPGILPFPHDTAAFAPDIPVEVASAPAGTAPTPADAGH